MLGMTACAATLTWMIVWDGRKRAAEGDQIREYHEARQIRAIPDAIGVFLSDGDRDTE
ncbi:hypothetical protein [Micromonospora sp. RTP1Z1]|uniref:hypothetical protein n=1 Tax=Micromonospora sp. RTP1Z1 TaxID=2994043 RepID=UPI0029C7409A|nr:hypothetical protein [Micromonospora sp. RTP1Z1]